VGVEVEGEEVKEEEDELKEEEEAREEVKDEEVGVEEEGEVREEAEGVMLVAMITPVTLVDVIPAKARNVTSMGKRSLVLLGVVVVEDLMMMVDVVVDECHSVLGLERGEGRVKFNKGGVH